MAQRSPWRIVIIDAGMLLSNEPMPIRPTSRAVTGTEAPIARAVNGITGRMAPSPSPNSREGPKAVRAICLSEKAAEVIGALYGIRWLPTQQLGNVKIARGAPYDADSNAPG